MRCGTVDSVGRTSKLVTGPFAATGVLASVVAAPFAALATAVAAPLTALALLATAVTALGAPAGAAEVVGEPYVVAAETGGDVLTLGEAPFHGSLADTPLNQPIVAMATTPTGDGYWLAAADGGVYAFGDADFHGSLGGDDRHAAVIDLDTAADGRGYWIVDDAGTVTAFGSAATIDGVAAGDDEPVVALAVRPDGTSGWLATSPNAHRWLGVALPADSGDGRRIVYSNSAQRIWLVDDRNRVEDSWLVSGRRGVPRPGTYSVFSKSRRTSAGHDGITMEYMVRFAHGRSLAIGFHSIPVYTSGRPLQTEAELGQYRSAGCVRQRLPQAAQLYGWADVGTTVVVLA